ncbi:unnamed protein product [Polarella glacialis]|uniref:Uncharacterized protein n=1 Tax=Polarella glacialis TaxID=89957 RepID=A0A813GBA5_POLGL|nr:unnamed protein product [Polarella glacialis]
MRLDAAEFVPSSPLLLPQESGAAGVSGGGGGGEGSPSPLFSAEQQPQPLPELAELPPSGSLSEGGPGLEGELESASPSQLPGLSVQGQTRRLSADTPEFVPSAVPQAWDSSAPGNFWDASGYSSQGYGADGPYQQTSDGVAFQYVDQEQFLTPQLLSEEELRGLEELLLKRLESIAAKAPPPKAPFPKKNEDFADRSVVSAASAGKGAFPEKKPYASFAPTSAPFSKGKGKAKAPTAPAPPSPLVSSSGAGAAAAAEEWPTISLGSGKPSPHMRPAKAPVLRKESVPAASSASAPVSSSGEAPPPADSAVSQESESVVAAPGSGSAAGAALAVSECLGSLRVEGRRLHWDVEGRPDEGGSDETEPSSKLESPSSSPPAETSSVPDEGEEGRQQTSSAAGAGGGSATGEETETTEPQTEAPKSETPAPASLQLSEVPPGQCLLSPKFCVAGVLLQLGFFPAGADLTGEGNCAVSVLCQEKTKLKFEVFLNGRGSGTKVMLGQKFSCDFRRPTSGVSSPVVSLEIHGNLLYGGGRGPPLAAMDSKLAPAAPQSSLSDEEGDFDGIDDDDDEEETEEERLEVARIKANVRNLRRQLEAAETKAKKLAVLVDDHLEEVQRTQRARLQQTAPLAAGATDLRDQHEQKAKAIHQDCETLTDARRGCTDSETRVQFLTERIVMLLSGGSGSLGIGSVETLSLSSLSSANGSNGLSRTELFRRKRQEERGLMQELAAIRQQTEDVQNQNFSLAARLIEESNLSHRLSDQLTEAEERFVSHSGGAAAGAGAGEAEAPGASAPSAAEGKGENGENGEGGREFDREGGSGPSGDRLPKKQKELGPSSSEADRGSASAEESREAPPVENRSSSSRLREGAERALEQIAEDSYRQDALSPRSDADDSAEGRNEVPPLPLVGQRRWRGDGSDAASTVEPDSGEDSPEHSDLQGRRQQQHVGQAAGLRSYQLEGAPDAFGENSSGTAGRRWEASGVSGLVLGLGPVPESRSRSRSGSSSGSASAELAESELTGGANGANGNELQLMESMLMEALGQASFGYKVVRWEQGLYGFGGVIAVVTLNDDGLLVAASKTEGAEGSFMPIFDFLLHVDNLVASGEFADDMEQSEAIPHGDAEHPASVPEEIEGGMESEARGGQSATESAEQQQLLPETGGPAAVAEEGAAAAPLADQEPSSTPAPTPAPAFAPGATSPAWRAAVAPSAAQFSAGPADPTCLPAGYPSFRSVPV